MAAVEEDDGKRGRRGRLRDKELLLIVRNERRMGELFSNSFEPLPSNPGLTLFELQRWERKMNGRESKLKSQEVLVCKKLRAKKMTGDQEMEIWMESIFY
jgi:hypothetical protein